MTTIKLKNGSGAPTAGDLVQGEPALDLTNKRLYTEDSGGTVIEVGTNPTSVTTGDITATGTATFAGLTTTADVSFGDNDKAIFGAGDLQIYHDGSNSFVRDQGTGDLKLQGNNLTMGNTADTKYFTATNGGGVSLFHQGNAKLGTTSTGIDVTGLVTATSNIVTSAGYFFGATNSYIYESAADTANLRVGSDGPYMILGKDIGGNAGAFGNSSGDLALYASNTEGMRLTSTGLGIGTDSPSAAIDVEGSGGGAVQAVISDGANQASLQLSKSANFYGIKAGSDYGGLLFFSNSATEAMRISSSGHLLVGTTDGTPYASNVSGAAFYSSGAISGSVDGLPALYLNRKTSDGTIADFRKDGSTVGSIGSDSADLTIGTNDTGFRFLDGSDSIAPYNVSTGAVRDNAIDLGYSAGRFDDIYATNSTIQTSDRNEKQDIEALSDAEQRVAVAAKGLLRKFRWIDSVEAKGDEARIHFGIIAQDLQDAFTAEGLDAGRYAMFINSTWTDEETGEERSRMGVRYSELLAFIISAI